MVITLDGEAKITNMLMPKGVESYADINIGWQINSFYFYTAPNNKKPLKKVIDESELTNQDYTYDPDKFISNKGLIQLQDEINVGNGSTLRSMAFEYNQYEVEEFPASASAHHHFKAAWEKLPNFVKTSSTDFSLITNIYIKRL